MDNRLALDAQSTQTDFGEIFIRNRRIGVFRIGTDPPPERRSTISTMLPCSYQNNRIRNLSGGSSGSTASGSSSDSSTQLDNQLSFMDFPLTTSSSSVPASRGGSSSNKLDRSWSDNDNGSQRSVNSSRYKTELCRPFEESGSCKYGDKCQFAHGYHELRNLARHPKYKTELCRTFHTVGFCPYGPRCHFIHEDETKSTNTSPRLGRDASVHSGSGSSSPSLSPSGVDDFTIFSYPTENSSPRMSAAKTDNCQFDALSVNTEHARNICDLHALEKRFSGMKLDRRSSNDVFCTNINQPRIIGSEVPDIFSEITMFNSAEVQLDNAPKSLSSGGPQSGRLDNFPCVDSHSAYWQSSYENYYSQLLKSADSAHISPTGSDGSSCSSNHSGSTDSLTSNSFTNWRCQVAIGQY
ncbi:unnamed protein product [Candidula unifasciata]|uniref:C3H1-type domain-containing protein n=1 Tax=Candidula unifasciata TaxID=100452 RepID=A0A8S3YCL0_9EUPU|nr:unnamed protein product [Candidula unifasciata]